MPTVPSTKFTEKDAHAHRKYHITHLRFKNNLNHLEVDSTGGATMVFTLHPAVKPNGYPCWNVAYGYAVCSSNDRYCRKEGRDLAIARHARGSGTGGGEIWPCRGSFLVDLPAGCVQPDTHELVSSRFIHRALILQILNKELSGLRSAIYSAPYTSVSASLSNIRWGLRDVLDEMNIEGYNLT